VENGGGGIDTVDYIVFEVKVLECHDRYEHETTSDEEDDSDFDPDAYVDDKDEDEDVGNEPAAANVSSGPAALAPPLQLPLQFQLQAKYREHQLQHQHLKIMLRPQKRHQKRHQQCLLRMCLLHLKLPINPLVLHCKQPLLTSARGH
jgi:hypothetical protein